MEDKEKEKRAKQAEKEQRKRAMEEKKRIREERKKQAELEKEIKAVAKVDKNKKRDFEEMHTMNLHQLQVCDCTTFCVHTHVE